MDEWDNSMPALAMEKNCAMRRGDDGDSLNNYRMGGDALLGGRKDVVAMDSSKDHAVLYVGRSLIFFSLGETVRKAGR